MIRSMHVSQARVLAWALATLASCVALNAQSAPTWGLTTFGQVMVFAGTGQAGDTVSPGAASEAGLHYPTSVAVDVQGGIYISDAGNNRIRYVNPATGWIYWVAGSGQAGYSGDGGSAGLARFNSPGGIAVDSFRTVYVADTYNHAVRRIDTGGGITTIAGNGTSASSGDGGLARAARLSNPTSLAIDAAGNIYIAEYCRVRRIAASTGIITTVVGTGTCGYTGDNGPATAARVQFPVYLALDRAQTLYVSDTFNNVVRKVNGGTITHFAGLAGGSSAGYPADDVLATSEPLDQPRGIATDPAGNVFIGEEGHGLVYRISASTGRATVLANGAYWSIGAKTDANATRLYGFSQPAVDANGNFYLAEPSQHKIFFSLAAGSPPAAGTGAAPAKTPKVLAGGVVNAASYKVTVSPGALISIYGEDFTNSSGEATVTPLPTTLAGVTVLIGNAGGTPVRAPLLYAGPGQINCQLPVEVKPGAATVTIVNGALQSAPAAFTVSIASPGLFADASAHAIAQNEDYALNTPSRPARPGEAMILYATGLGPVSPEIPSGAAATRYSLPNNPVSATIGGAAAGVLFAGAIPGFVNLFQINLRVPLTAPPGDVDTVISVAGLASNAARVSIASVPVVTHTVTLRMVNNLLYPTEFFADSKSITTVAAGATADKLVATGSSLSVSFKMVQPTLGGRTLGEPLNATFDSVANPSGTIVFTAKASLGNANYFAPRITNQTSVDLLLGVNMGLASEIRCNCTAPANTSNVAFGYYRYYSNSNVHGYLAGTNYTGGYSYFGWDAASPSGTISGVDSNTGLVSLTFAKAPAPSGGSGSGGSGTTSGAPSSTYFLDYYGTMAKGAAHTEGFTLSARTTLVFRFTSDYAAQAAIMNSSQGAVFRNNQSFSAIDLFDSRYGTHFVTLAAGSYVVGVRNASASPNRARYEVDYEVDFPGLKRIDAQSYSGTVSANGGWATQGFSIQQGIHYWVDGCNSGLDVYLIDEKELSNFTGNRQFQYHSDYSGVDSKDLPGGYEVKLPPGNYYFAFRNHSPTPGTFTMTVDRWR